MIMETIHMKVLAENEEARVKAEKKEEVKEFKHDFSMLEQYR